MCVCVRGDPQVDVRDFGYADRPDFTDARKARLREAVHRACAETPAHVVLHVGQDPADLQQLAHLPDGLEVRSQLVRSR